MSLLTAQQTARNRELSKEVFGENHDLKYGPAIFLPQYCGKWTVWNHDILHTGYLTGALGLGDIVEGMVERSVQQGVDLYEIGQAAGDARVPPTISRCASRW